MANRLADEMRECLPVLSRTSLVLKGPGGTAGATYHLCSATNLATPLAKWTPVQTNVFDQYGVFNFTKTASLALQKQLYFRLAAP